MDVSPLGEPPRAGRQGLVEGAVMLGRGVVNVACGVGRCLHVVKRVCGRECRSECMCAPHVHVGPEGEDLCFVVQVLYGCAFGAACSDAEGSVLCDL